MTCAWKELLSILPPWLSQEADKFQNDVVQEVRLRLGQPPQLRCKDAMHLLKGCTGMDDLNFCINTASRYSPWAAQTIAKGYLTAPGGHRIGLCGEAVVQSGQMTGIRTIRSLCIRVARDFPGIAEKYAHHSGSVLIIGPPGSGKTTFLRDLVRQFAQHQTVAVADERCELFPDGYFSKAGSLDVLSGCPKVQAIDILLRTMGPETIAVDEITASEDCAALLHAGWCGVRLVATAHAAGIADLQNRSLYKPLLSANLFRHILVLRPDKSLYEERMTL